MAKKKKKGESSTELKDQYVSLQLINQMIDSGTVIPDEFMRDEDIDGLDDDIEEFLRKKNSIADKGNDEIIEKCLKDLHEGVSGNNIIFTEGDDEFPTEPDTESETEEEASSGEDSGSAIPDDIEMEPPVLGNDTSAEPTEEVDDALPYIIPKFAISYTTHGKYELVRIADGIRSFTIDLNTLDVDDPDVVGRFTDIAEIVELRLREVLPHLYPSAIITQKWMQENLSGIDEFNYDRFLFYRNDNENILFVYDLDPMVDEMLQSIASVCYDKHVLVSFLNAILQIASNVGFSFRNLRESYGDELMQGDEANYCRNIFNIAIHRDEDTVFGNENPIENVFRAYPEDYYNDTLDMALDTFGENEGLQFGVVEETQTQSEDEIMSTPEPEVGTKSSEGEESDVDDLFE